MAYWLNNKFWICDRHVPSARVSASSERCWYNCGTLRPAGDPPPPPNETPVVTTPKTVPVRASKPIESPKVVSIRPKNPTVPEVSGEEPPPKEKRRGATAKVFCPECGVVLWRRPKDVVPGAEFFCSQAHRHAHRKRA